jgi:hypothetical protein
MSNVQALTPVSTVSTVVLSSSVNIATEGDVITSHLPYNVYGTGGPLYSTYFLSGAAEQVAFTFKKLGGDVLDIEITNGNVYAAYEEATLEYSYIINMHQAKNSLSNILGNTTGTFNDKGELLSGQNAALKYPKFKLEYFKKMSQGISEEAGFGGTTNLYSASIPIVDQQQDYDIQEILSGNIVADPTLPYASALGSGKNNRVRVRSVYYISPRAIWRFFGYYGGLNVVGNLSNYGQYTDASTYEVIPTWQNKLQAMMYEDSIKTRVSNFSYEIFNNNIRIYPPPQTFGSYETKYWIRFTIDSADATTETDSSSTTNLDGVNNVNTLPFSNIPYENINSMGKQWIRRFALALTKEMLGQVRGKFNNTIPIPGDNVSLNADQLLSQAKDEQEKLREELKTMLNDLTYEKLVESDKNKVTNSVEVYKQIPAAIMVG